MLTGWTNGPAFSGMYKTLQEGIIARGMASYNSILPEDRINLILYVRTFNPGFPVIDQKEISAVDAAYSLSKGFKLPNQIPVKMAEEKVLEESKAFTEKIDNVANTILKENNEKGAVIFKKMSFDVKRSVTALAGYTKWDENENAFVKFVSVSPVVKGFNASQNGLTSEEWGIVYQYLKNLLSKT